MTDNDIKKTFNSFINWLKSKNKKIEVEVLETNHYMFNHGVRIHEDDTILLIGYGKSDIEAMKDVLEDAIINYELSEVNNCSSVEELAVRLAVMGF